MDSESSSSGEEMIVDYAITSAQEGYIANASAYASVYAAMYPNRGSLVNLHLDNNFFFAPQIFLSKAVCFELIGEAFDLWVGREQKKQAVVI
jgi:hypothetical protein